MLSFEEQKKSIDYAVLHSQLKRKIFITKNFLGLPERAEEEFHLSVCFSAILQVSFSIKYIILVTTNSGHVSHSLL